MLQATAALLASSIAYVEELCNNLQNERNRSIFILQYEEIVIT